MFFVRLLPIFSLDKFVVKVFQILETGNRILLVLVCVLLLELVVGYPKHLELVLKFLEIFDRVFQVFELVGAN